MLHISWEKEYFTEHNQTIKRTRTDWNDHSSKTTSRKARTTYKIFLLSSKTTSSKDRTTYKIFLLSLGCRITKDEFFLFLTLAVNDHIYMDIKSGNVGWDFPRCLMQKITWNHKGSSKYATKAKSLSRAPFLLAYS